MPEVLRARDILEAIEMLQSIVKSDTHEEGIFLAEDGEASIHGHPVRFTGSETALMAAFLGAPGRMFTFAELNELVSGSGFRAKTTSMRSMIRHLRRKLEPIPGVDLDSVYGAGFRLVLTEAD